MAQFSFCHGWMVSPKDFNEVTCPRRESCAYYDVLFYRHHGHHLDDFDEMFPFEPCQFYIKKIGVQKEEDQKDNKYDIFLAKK